MANEATFDEDNAWQSVVQGRSGIDPTNNPLTDSCFTTDWDLNAEVLADCPDLDAFVDFNCLSDNYADVTSEPPQITVSLPDAATNHHDAILADQCIGQSAGPATTLQIPDAQAIANIATGQLRNASTLQTPFAFKNDILDDRITRRRYGSVPLPENLGADLRSRVKRLEVELQESKRTLEMLREYFVGLGPWVQETHRQTDCMWELQHDMLNWQSCVEQSWIISTNPDDAALEDSCGRGQQRVCKNPQCAGEEQ